MPRFTTKELSTRTWPNLEISRKDFPNRAAQTVQNRREKKELFEREGFAEVERTPLASTKYPRYDRNRLTAALSIVVMQHATDRVNLTFEEPPHVRRARGCRRGSSRTRRTGSSVTRSRLLACRTCATS